MLLSLFKGVKMKKKIIMAFLLGSIVFSAGVKDIIKRNNMVIENERKQRELEERQKELERQNFGKEPQIIEGADEAAENSQKIRHQK